MTRSSEASLAERFAGVEAGYERRTPGSRRRWERSRGLMPSGVSGGGKFFDPYPVFVREGRGPRITDVDGNEYVDVLMGNGCLLLGHAHPQIVEAVRRQSERLLSATMPHEAGAELAERIAGHMPYLERLRFTNTGSEATRSALRVARSATGRRRLAKCEGGFHGSDDHFLVSTHSRRTPGDDRRPAPAVDYAGAAGHVEDDVVVLPYNDVAAAEAAFEEHGPELAAVFFEPVAFSSGGAVPATPEFAAALRAGTRRHGIVLVADEVVTGFRLGLEGVPAYLGIEPDLSTIGKAMAGGMPLAAFGGRADLMEEALAGPPDRRIFQSGTFTEHPVSIAAAAALLDVVEADPGLLARANRRGDELRAGLRALLAEAGVEGAVTGTATLLHVHLGTAAVENRRDLLRADLEATRLFQLALVARGVLWLPLHPAALSVVHGDAEVGVVLEAAESALFPR